MKFPWSNPRYYDNSDGTWDFMPLIHQPSGSDPLHSDWPKPFNKIPRTWTSWIFLDAQLLSGDPQHWVNRVTLEQHRGLKPFVDPPNDSMDRPQWVPKPWGLRGTHQKTRIVFMDPVSKVLSVHRGVYHQRTLSNGFAWRRGPRISDDDRGGKPAFYVNWVPLKSLSWLTFGTKRIGE